MYLKLTDFKTREVTGTTNGSANTQSLFRHATPSDPQAPTGWMILEGRGIYIPINGAGAEVIDVRSTATSQPFRILVFY
jgi:hypothetical protein